MPLIAPNQLPFTYVLLLTGGAFVAGAVLSFLLTPTVAHIAARTGLLDWPDERKRHGDPVPRLGGVAVFAGLLTSFFCYWMALGWEAVEQVFANHYLVALLAACVIVFFLGLADDLWKLSPATRIVTEAIAALVLIQGEYVIDRIAVPWGDPIVLGPLSYPVTLLFFLGVTNAFNLIDGIDGLLAAVGITALAGCAAIGLLGGQVGTAMLALALAGSLAGFLPWNWHKARIFIGDAGSLLVGFAIAALSLKLSRETPTSPVMLHVIFAVCALPIFDIFLTVARRYASGRPFFSGDRGHIHHVLMSRGLTPPRAVAVLAGMQALWAALAALLFAWPDHPLVLIPVALVLLLTVLGIHWLGYVELKVVVDHVRQGLFRRRRPALTDAVALARAGEVLREADSPSGLKDGLRAAVVESQFTYIAIELASLGQRVLAGEAPVTECRNVEAAAYSAANPDRPLWLFSTEATVADEHTLGSVVYTMQLPAADGRFGRLVCHRFHGAERPAPGFNDMERYLARPVADALAIIDAAAAPPPGAEPSGTPDAAADPADGARPS